MEKIISGLRGRVVPFAAIIALLLFSAISRSQARDVIDDPELKATRLTDWMRFNLGLSEDQMQMVQAINLKYANKVEDVKNGELTKRQKIIALRADGQAMDRELKTIFSAQQFQIYLSKKEEIQKQLKEKVKSKRNN
jgi:hypothetical protein